MIKKRKEEKDDQEEEIRKLVAILACNWWAIAFRGLLALLFGLLLLVRPVAALEYLGALFGPYAIVDGILAILAEAKVSRHSERWWALPIGGLYSIAVGVISIILPGVTAVELLYFVAFRAVVLGFFEIAAAVMLRRELSQPRLLTVSGATSLVFGVALALWPVAGVLEPVWLMGSYATLYGAMLSALGLRSWGQDFNRELLDAACPRQLSAARPVQYREW